MGNIIDITERKLAEKELEKEKEKFRVLVEDSPLGVSLIGQDGQYIYLNPKFTEIFGYRLEDIPTGREWFERAYPDIAYRSQVISTWINDKKEPEEAEEPKEKKDEKVVDAEFEVLDDDKSS